MREALRDLDLGRGQGWVRSEEAVRFAIARACELICGGCQFAIAAARGCVVLGVFDTMTLHQAMPVWTITADCCGATAGSSAPAAHNMQTEARAPLQPRWPGTKVHSIHRVNY
jgi:hypothetical protein